TGGEGGVTYRAAQLSCRQDSCVKCMCVRLLCPENTQAKHTKTHTPKWCPESSGPADVGNCATKVRLLGPGNNSNTPGGEESRYRGKTEGGSSPRNMSRCSDSRQPRCTTLTALQLCQDVQRRKNR